MYYAGFLLKVNGFLYSSQNSETVTCAELTVLGIVNSLAHISSNYKSIVPSDIILSKSAILHERILPSKGLPYEIVSQLLNKYAGSSRLYFLDEDEKSGENNKCETLRKLFHIYVESGIPLAVAVKGKDADESRIRHSIICIGHGSRNYEWSKNPQRISGFSVIDSYRAYNDYILIDDNQPPYTIQEYGDFTVYKDIEIAGFVVSLPRSAFLEADEAYFIGIEALFYFSDTKLDESFLVENYKYDVNNNSLVTRLYLTTSAKFKRFKNKPLTSNKLIDFYLTLNLPHYIWVMEISTAELYSSNLAFGDVIIDATHSNTQNGMDSIISIHYGDRLGCVEFNELSDLINTNREKVRKRWGDFNIYNDVDERFQLFSNNDNSLRSID